MPKYRILTTEELNELESIFINFLAANSITAKDWENIKKNDKEKADQLIEQFSDVVFTKTLANVNLLEKRLKDKLLMYRFDEKEIKLLGLELKGFSPLDFRNEFSLQQLSDLFTDEKRDISFITGTKPYFENPEKEIFDLMESGAMISQNLELFDT
ncbi:MAG TPA: hypothetical protein ENK91_04170, partial [Bacteroidetes bacterium]|nr:hypothetical protein [Bacteroidota bacterium]